MIPEGLADRLALLNATLNASSALFLMMGFVFIKRGDRVRHRLSMLSALTCSSVFLVFYVIRFSLSGTHTFAGEGVVKIVYLTILFSHIVLAVIIVPFVVRLVYLATHDRFREHARLARFVYPSWIYVSLTGLLVYVLLYHVYGYV